jgi:hypothetical protein
LTGRNVPFPPPTDTTCRLHLKLLAVPGTPEHAKLSAARFGFSERIHRALEQEDRVCSIFSYIVLHRFGAAMRVDPL